MPSVVKLPGDRAVSLQISGQHLVRVHIHEPEFPVVPSRAFWKYQPGEYDPRLIGQVHSHRFTDATCSDAHGATDSRQPKCGSILSAF